MLKRIFALLVVLCTFGALQNPAAAQARDGWVVDLEPMWMNVKGFDQHGGDVVRSTTVITTSPLRFSVRSEERRVGKECRSRWLTDLGKRKEDEDCGNAG